MSYRESDNGGEKTRPWKVYTVPVSLQAHKRKAFREWPDASKAWSVLRQAIEANGGTSTAKRELAELERRLVVAADAFEQTQQRLSDSPLYAYGAGEEQLRSE